MDSISQIKKLKLNDLVILAQNCKYNEPEGDFKSWNETNLYFTSISRYINDPFLVHLTLTVCNKIPPVKLFVKHHLRSYIKVCNSN
tara:strand:- start:922 stop:1179 length:258 start_codon:yes stop_codon:yes gene_type:complete